MIPREAVERRIDALKVRHAHATQAYQHSKAVVATAVNEMASLEKTIVELTELLAEDVETVEVDNGSTD